MSKNNYAVTVLMPVFNARRYLAAALESILAQTFTDFQFLIIDDGSTDTSMAMLRRYARHDTRIRRMGAVSFSLLRHCPR